MKNTKTKLISSVTVLLICFAMLIGSTFAWFTDSASTGVNKIQAGNLDVEIVNPNNGQRLSTLEWLKATGAQTEEVLWEPGVTYKLTTFAVKNVGDLALKFKMNISVGNETVADTGEKLSNVISWKIYTNESNTISGDEAASLYDTFDKEDVYKLEADQSKVFSILATMDTGAGNEYKGLSMDSITVDVKAAQDTVENDSFGNQYDVNAQYPVVAVANVTVDQATKQVKETVKVSTAETVGSTNQPVATLTVPENVVTDGTGSLTMSVTESETPSEVTNAIAVTSDTKTLEVKVTGLDKDNNNVPLTVEAYVGENLTGFALYHYSTPMSSASGANLIDGDYFYNDVTGIVTFKSITFSPFTVVFDKDTWDNYAANSLTKVEDTYLIGTAEELALFAKEVNKANSDYTSASVKLTNDIDLGEYLWIPIGQTSGGQFSGTFDGDNYTISNLFVKNNSDWEHSSSGLFGWLNTGIVKNVKVDTANVSGHSYAGSIVGYIEAIPNSSVINCHVTNAIVSSTSVSTNSGDDGLGDGSKVGGVVGYAGNSGTLVKDCTVTDSKIDARRDAGQVVGCAKTSYVDNCSATNVSVRGNNTGASDSKIGTNINEAVIGRVTG